MLRNQIELLLVRELAKATEELKEDVAYIRGWCGVDHDGDSCIRFNVMLHGPFDYDTDGYERLKVATAGLMNRLGDVANAVAEASGEDWCLRFYHNVRQLADREPMGIRVGKNDPHWEPPQPLSAFPELSGPLSLADVIKELKGLKERVEELERKEQDREFREEPGV